MRRARVAGPVRAAVSALSPPPPPSGWRLLVTSACHDDGKSFVTALLGLGLAEQRHSVALVDADPAQGALARHFPARPARGRRARWSRQSNPLQVELPRVLTPQTVGPDGGRGAHDPTSVVDVLERVSADGEAVAVNGLAVLAGADLSSMADYADAVVMVVRAGVTRVTDARAAARVLRSLDVPLAGVVVTDAMDSGSRATPLAAWWRSDVAFDHPHPARQPRQQTAVQGQRADDRPGSEVAHPGAGR